MSPKIKPQKRVKKKSEGALTLQGLETFYEKVIAPQFQGIQGQFQVMNGQIQGIHGQLHGVQGQFVEINEKLEEHDRKFDKIFNHIDGLYKVFDDLKIEYEVLLGGVRRATLQERIKQMEARLSHWDDLRPHRFWIPLVRRALDKLLALQEEKIQKFLEGKTIMKVIFAPNKILNLVVK